MAKTSFQGPVQTGNETGAPATSTIGTVVAVQRATVASNTSGASNIVLPSCAMVNAHLAVRTGVSGAVVTVRVGATANESKYCAIDASAAGLYSLGGLGNEANASAAAMETIAGPQRLYVDATAAGSAAGVANFDAILTIEYIQR